MTTDATMQTASRMRDLERYFTTWRAGRLDLGWLGDEGTEWGVHAKPGSKGLLLKDINVGSYGEIPKRAPYRGMAIRGVPEDADTLDMGYTINTAAEVMSANVFSLYEEAKARQWNAACDIPWVELPQMDPDVEHAMCKLCSFLTEVEFIAADAPAQFLPHINHCYLEAKMFLATQAMDEARHTEVFRKRALANGGGLTPVNKLVQGALKSIRNCETYTQQTAKLHLLGEGVVLSIFRAGEFLGNNYVDKRIFRLCMQDEARHVSYGTMHIRQFLQECPDREEELHEALDDLEQYLGAILLSPDIVESMAVLFAGGVKDADQGLGAVRLLWGRTLEEYFSRCDRAGLNRRPRCTLPLEVPF
jgi:hypothetical protein